MSPADPAAVFAALGDRTRLALLARLGDGEARSITALTAGGGISRQAVTRHLNVLKDAGLVRQERSGRECRWAADRAAIAAAGDYLASIAGQWEDALGRLAAHVEGGG